MPIIKRLSDWIGNTPLLALDRYAKAEGLFATILAKSDGMNPAGSSKDRIAKAMIDDGEARGLLSPGGVIIEPTSGNTGIGLAAVAAERGYRLILTMPDTMTQERRSLLVAYGAELVLTEGKLGMRGAMEKAAILAREIPGSFIPGQFSNPKNPAIHRATTGPEIWQDTKGQVDVFVAGVGTGGTITGVGEFLKQMNPNIRIVAVEPLGSPVLSQGRSGPHGIQGIGAGFVPEVLNQDIYDEVITVTEEEAYQTAKAIARLEGLLSGISSGAAVFAAAKLARQAAYQGKTIVAFLPDSGERYLSTGMFG